MLSYFFLLKEEKINLTCESCDISSLSLVAMATTVLTFVISSLLLILVPFISSIILFLT